MKCTRELGFTLVELMIVIVVISILVAIAAPNFDSLIKKNNVEALQTKLASAMSAARTEAASRNTVVTICKSNNSETCVAASTWSNGWVVFEDRNGDQAFTSGADILIDQFLNEGEYLINTAQAAISFSVQGFLTGGSAATFIVCEPKKNVTYARGLFVNTSGLILKTSDTDGDGTHNDPGNLTSELVCI